MITLIPKRRVRIPNHLAVFAALLLSIAAVSGAMNNTETRQMTEQNIEATAPQGDSVATTTESKKRKLNISSLLFGNG